MLPLDYFNALDALPSFVEMDALGWVCSSAEFHPTLHSRIPTTTTPHFLLWVEPQIDEPLPVFNNIRRLIIITSQPLARVLPERKGWRDAPLGIRWLGQRQIKQKVQSAGWRVSAEHHFHTIRSIALNLLSQRVPQPARADQLQFAARQRYTTNAPAFATVVLTVYDRR